MPVHRDLPVAVVKSLYETQDVFRANNIPFTVQMDVGSSVIEAARSKSAHGFLQSDATRLFWVDSDIAWKPSDFLKLSLYSTVMDVVCGAYCHKKDNGAFPLAGIVGDKTNEYGCIEILGTGLGFTVVNREIVEQLAAKSPRLKFPDMPEPIAHIFRCDEVDGAFRGEDMAFFADVRALGYKVWLDPQIELQHIGSKAYSARFMDHLTLTPVA